MFQLIFCIIISILSIAFSSGLIISLKYKLNEGPGLAINEITRDISFYYLAAKIAAISIIPLIIVAIAVVYFVNKKNKKNI